MYIQYNCIALSTSTESKEWKESVFKLNSLIDELERKPQNEDNHQQLVDDIELDSASIFAAEDLILYRGVLYFYLQKYKDA